MLYVAVILASVLLNEVLYDPEGPDTGREFVEIVNVSTAPVPLSELEIEAGDGARPGTWKLVWRGSAGTLDPGALLVVGGDSLGTRERLLADLQNGPDAVRLRRGTAVLDLLGYGSLSTAELYEGHPASDVSGESLARHPDGSDSDDNARDFIASRPSPGRWNEPRHDLAVGLDEPDPTRAWPGRRIAARLVIRNPGRELALVGNGRLSATLREASVESSATRPLAVTVPDALSPGDSAVSELAWVGSAGLFRIEVALSSEDEDPTNDQADAWVRIGAGAVLVNEIQFAPEVGADEWVELWNRDGLAHDLAGWTLEDASGRRSRLVARDAIPPGGYAIASGDTTRGIESIVPGTRRVAVTPWNTLNNTDGDDGFADRLVLRDANGVVHDAVLYSAAWSRERGRSLERLVADPDVRGLLWAACKAPERATPGRSNSAFAPPARGSRLDLAPNPFSPDGDGLEELLVAAIEVPVGYDGFRARIFDLEGRQRATLAADRLGPGPRRLSWDGTDDAGRSLPRGIYLFDLELYSKSSPVHRELRAVGLARP